MRNALWAAVAVFGLLACGVEDVSVDDAVSEQTTADAPLLGAGGTDGADRSCNVVLRSLERGATDCSSGTCWWVFTGVIDLSAQAVAEGAKPRALYKNLDATTWSTATPAKTTGAPAGFVRYTFTLKKKTIAEGMSATAYARANVQVAPYLLAKSGARLFDHNRLPGELDTYVVNQAGGWSIGPDAAVCGTDVVVDRALTFSGSFQNTQRGALVAGQSVTINYAIDRLQTCRGTHNGFPAWDVTANVRALPSGQVLSGTVRGFDAPGGTPSNASAISVPYTLTIPSGSTSIEVWFKNSTGAGSSCEAWDSNDSANYVYPVSATSPARPSWAGDVGSSFNRSCSRVDGAPTSVTLDSYLQQRACMFVELDVYVLGLTDAGAGPSGSVFAQVESKLDGVVQPAKDAQFIGRVGNNWRFHYELPKSDLYYGPKWQQFDYGFRFSSDGRVWLRESTRSVVRDVSFCNPAWGGC